MNGEMRRTSENEWSGRIRVIAASGAVILASLIVFVVACAGLTRIDAGHVGVKINLLLTRSITPALLDWKRLEVTTQAVAKWDGKRPMVEGAGSNLLLQILPPK